MRSVWGFRGLRVGMLFAVFGVGYTAAIVAPGWVQAQPEGRTDWPAGELLRNGDLNRLVQKVRDLETRMNTSALGAPSVLAPVAEGNNPATYAGVSSPSLVTLVPSGFGVDLITFTAAFGSTSVARVRSGGGSAVVVVPANQALTVAASLGAGASPSIIVTRYPLNH